MVSSYAQGMLQGARLNPALAPHARIYGLVHGELDVAVEAERIGAQTAYRLEIEKQCRQLAEVLERFKNSAFGQNPTTVVQAVRHIAATAKKWQRGIKPVSILHDAGFSGKDLNELTTQEIKATAELIGSHPEELVAFTRENAASLKNSLLSAAKPHQGKLSPVLVNELTTPAFLHTVMHAIWLKHRPPTSPKRHHEQER